MRKYITNYFGFECQKQERCCSLCQPDIINPFFEFVKIKRTCTDSNVESFKKEIDDCLESLKNVSLFPVLDFNEPNLIALRDNIFNNISDVVCEKDLLDIFGVFDQNCRTDLFSVIEKLMCS